MKNNKISERLTASRCMRITSAAIASSIMLTLTACGDSSSQQDSGMVTEENSTIERVTEIPNEPGYDIASGADIPETSTEEPSSTEESPSDNGTVENPPTSGAYTYTVYGDIQLSMDVNVDDYIITNSSGQEVFQFTRMAIELGWWPNDINPEEFGGTMEGWVEYSSNESPTSFSYHSPSGEVVFMTIDDLSDHDSRYDYNQIGYIEYRSNEYQNPDSPLPNEDTNFGIDFNNHYNDVQYLTPFTPSVMASRDDIIILSYVLSRGNNSSQFNFFATMLQRYESGGTFTNTDYRLP